MATPRATAEVLPLFTPGSLSPLRIFLSLAVLLLFLLLALFAPKKVKKGPKGSRTILLVGPLASGKTALFSKLLYGAAPATHTSIKENEGIVKACWSDAVGGKSEQLQLEKDTPPAAITSQALATPLHLVDTPGHPRLRTRSMAHFLPAADGVVFTIDGQVGLSGKNVREAGEHLHLLLSLLSLLPSGNTPPLLILLTKSDLLASSSSTTTSTPSSKPLKSPNPTLTLDRARQSLAREMERRRLAIVSSSSSGRAGGAGARLEGLEAIPASSSSSSSGGVVQTLLSAVGLGGSQTTTITGESAAGLPEDEAEVLDRGEAFGFEGTFEWAKVEEALGVRVKWAVGSVKGGEKGTGEVWEWVEEL